MTNVVFQYVGKVKGVAAYAPLDLDDMKLLEGRELIVCDVKGMKSLITELQVRSVHLYFQLLADALNAAGWDMRTALDKLSKNTFIPWSAHTIKEKLWRAVQLNTYGTESIKKLGTAEVSVVYEALNQVTADKLGVSIPFPERYSQMCESIERTTR